MTEEKDFDGPYKHPSHFDLWTPWNEQFLELLNQMRVEYGSWRKVCEVSKTRLKAMRNLRNGSRKAVSMRVVDRLCSTTGVGSIEDFVWFTAWDLVALGVWKKPADPLTGETPETVPGRKKAERIAKHKRRLERERIRQEKADAFVKGIIDERTRRGYTKGYTKGGR